MSIYNYFVIVFLVYYSFYFYRLFIKRNRTIIQEINKNMDKYRKIKIKTLEQQKEFINLKYPKKQKFIFSWNWLLQIIIMIIISILLFLLYNKIFLLLHINISLWLAILFIILFPIIINLILKKFNLQQDDLTIFLR